MTRTQKYYLWMLASLGFLNVSLTSTSATTAVISLLGFQISCIVGGYQLGKRDSETNNKK